MKTPEDVYTTHKRQYPFPQKDFFHKCGIEGLKRWLAHSKPVSGGGLF
jgi:hypothetical protein